MNKEQYEKLQEIYDSLAKVTDKLKWQFMYQKEKPTISPEEMELLLKAQGLVYGLKD